MVKVTCGDHFAALLTCLGEVFTFGENSKGELGLDNSIAIAIEPIKVKLDTRIIDIVAGYNHCLGLSERKEVYGWGKRMGVY